MNKYYGNIGFYDQVELRPGVIVDNILERPYYGDVVRNKYRYVSGEKVNNDINIDNSISVVMDPYAYQNFKNIRYVEWNGTKWRVSDIEVQYPRLILSLGGMYVESEQPIGIT